MYMINVKAFTERERAIRMEEDFGTDVLEFHDDETTDYAILSHRWIGKEVDYKEMTKLAKMNKREQKAVRDRDGYKKILASCEKAKSDGYKWLWVDTCCIDKRSSAELSEAINSMYRWYTNSRVCYAYLHDVTSTSFPTRSDDERYPISNGWSEWFSRGWTLQEMIAPSNLQFFNKDWQPIGDKRTLTSTLSKITRVPECVLRDGLSSNRPCVAQIISWAANRKTTRVEDRAYSLMGLLDVNMPMLYGEGKKAFHRLQLEIIRMSSDQSIFAWGFDGVGRTGSILADDPSFFEGCNLMELMDPSEFIRRLEDNIPEEELPLIEDRCGTFPITNRGIQMWMFLRPSKDSDSVFEACLPCRFRRSDSPMRITLALWNSNYYRYCTPERASWRSLQFRQIYLRYHDIHHNVTFEIDDSAITRNGFTCYSSPRERKTFTSTGTDPLCVKAYSDRAGSSIVVGIGQCFGQDWIHIACKEPTSEQSPGDFLRSERRNMRARAPELAQSMAEVRSRRERDGFVWMKHLCLPGSIWTVRTSCVHLYTGPIKWISIYVEGTNDPNHDVRGLMIPRVVEYTTMIQVDGVSKPFSPAPNGVKLGDYGYFTDDKAFHREGNISMTTPMQHKISNSYGDSDYVDVGHLGVKLYKPVGFSVAINDNVKSWLDDHSIGLMNKYLVTMIIQCPTVPSSGHMSFPTLCPTTPFCIFRKPFVWHQDRDFVGGVSR
ncbi:heterokaryon incompatibility protein-domain-containing protein [Scleroderma yunnanense]